MRMKYIRPLTIALGISAFVATAAAAPVVIDTGVQTTIPQAIQGFVDVLLKWSSFVVTGLFLLGAILMVGSGGNDAYLSAGKKIMQSCLIGYAIILASWLVISTVVFFIAG